MSKEKDSQDRIIRDAQYRKGLSIAYFNSLNSAIALVTPIIKDLKVEEVKQDKHKVKVALSMFGRTTSVELDFAQVEKA